MNKKRIICLGIIFTLLLLVFVILPPPLVSFKNSNVHLSFDDVEFCLKDISNNDKYSSLYEQNFFAYIKRLHDRYGVCITLYTYADGLEGWRIEQMTGRFKQEFMAASDWLKIGFHASSPQITKDSIKSFDKFANDYNRVKKSIYYFAGKKSLATILRLHYFFATAEEVEFLRAGGVCQLLSADDDRLSYSLDTLSNKKLILNEFLVSGGIEYKRTDIRVENTLFPNISLLRNSDEKDLIIFTHEWALNSIRKIKLEYMLWRINLEN